MLMNLIITLNHCYARKERLPISCLCGKYFNQKENLKWHFVTHTHDKMFKYDEYLLR